MAAAPPHRRVRPRSTSVAFSQDDQKLAHLLLVELLAHQFCYPVQWIETQDLVLGDRRTERLVEFGPSGTLATMAKRTLDAKYRSRDTAQNTSRQLLAFESDIEKISYDEKTTTIPILKDQTPAPKEPAAAPVTYTPPATAAVEPLLASVQAVAEIEDSPPKASEILTTIVSIGLKKSLDDAQLGKSIKALAGGRSTLQNEIIGDLSAEFNTTPDGAEDLPLLALGESLQKAFSGRLGKKSASLIDKMISSKSPGTFQSTAVRKYLRSRWGLASGRQDSVLLEAVIAQPDARMKTEVESKIFLDSIAQIYMKKNGVTLPTAAGPAVGGPAPVTVDPENLAFLENKQNSIMKQQMQIYAEQLGINADASEEVISSLKQRVAELERQLDLWNTEHGEVYASGIRPLFTVLKARVYDSWWNWAVQDLLVLLEGLRSGTLRPDSPTFKDLRQRLINRSHTRLVEIMSFASARILNNESKQAVEALIKDVQKSLTAPSFALRQRVSMAPVTTVNAHGKVLYSEKPRSEPDSPNSKADSSLRLGRKDNSSWKFDDAMSDTYQQILSQAVSNGLSFHEKTVLLTGAGEASIGAEILRILLAGGAQVIVTSSSYSPKVTKYYQSIFTQYGGKDSQLVLVPFNQASHKDVEALVSYIYDKSGLHWDLDVVIPFAAIGEAGREIDSIDGRSELAHRLMLTNLLRLLGVIKAQKAEKGSTSRPAQVLLPLSPNHGTFGNDGLYAESKLGLESLFQKWHSENWGDYLTICGAVIGWTRGTALMADNDIVSEGIEKHGMRTYSQQEMAFHILALTSPQLLQLSVEEPLLADLSGGMGLVKNLKEITTQIRQGIMQKSEELQAISKDTLSDEPVNSEVAVTEKQANIEFKYPTIPDYETEIRPLQASLQGTVDLDRVVVVTGFAEVGPCGNSRTRWLLESAGKLGLEGCVEMAWIMGLIKHHSGFVDGAPYSGWLDKESGKPISDMGIQKKYEQHIVQHSGLRLMEPKFADDKWDGRDTLYEIEIARDQEPFETSAKVAQELKKVHGDKVVVSEMADTEQVKVVLKRGARIMLPSFNSSTHTVGGQLPTGWNARTYGIPEDIASSVDPAALYALVCAAEALQSAGIFDAYELYNHIHISELGNCVGSGFGGLTSLRRIFRDRYQDKPCSNDILAESFINSPPAWINMLLLSSAGPNKTPVGACATAIESLDTGFDLIVSGKAKACLVGGYDDMNKDEADEFANLKATMNSTDDLARGRDPKEMSRPATTTRKGFVESEGAGIQLITSASLALEMGLPIYGIVALTNTASDKNGRSLPAPGRGVAGSAAQTKNGPDSPLMNIRYRKRNLEMRKSQIEESKELQMAHMEEEITNFKDEDESFEVEEYRKQRLSDIEADVLRQEKEALNLYGNQFWRHDKRIAPIRGALAVWGLTVDDIDVASFHGTSTKANEKNECEVVNAQLSFLGRGKGNVVPGVFQKHLTGHPKGAAGAWMLNGCLQIMESSVVPGNRNADNIDTELRKFDLIAFPNQSIRAAGVRAFTLTSFGFGQKGAQLIGVHPKYLYATLDESTLNNYRKKVQLRQKKASRRFHEGLANNTVFVAKDKPPYAIGQELDVLLDPSARFSTP